MKRRKQRADMRRNSSFYERSSNPMACNAMYVLICQINSFVTSHRVNITDRMFSLGGQSGMRACIIYTSLFIPSTFY